MPEKKTPQTPPRDNLYRGVFPMDVRANDDEPAGPPKLVGHFAKFNEWTQIESFREGRFMERIAPGAFADAFRDYRDRIKLLFQHGQDPTVGEKVIGGIDELREDEQGAYYEAHLYDGLEPLVMNGLTDGGYGASFKFSVVEQELDRNAKRSATNPEGLPERTVTKAHLFEFGPVTFPAYAGATAGVRSMTDRFTTESVVNLGPHSPRAESSSAPESPKPERLNGSPTAHQGTHSPLHTPETTPMDIERMEPELRVSRLGEIKSRQAELNTEYAGAAFPDEIRAEWDSLKAEKAKHESVLAELERRNAELAQAAETRTQYPVNEDFSNIRQINKPSTRDIYDVDGIRNRARSNDEERQMLSDNAKRAIELSSFTSMADRSVGQAHAEKVLSRDDEQGTVARLILSTGSPTYDRAFVKALKDQPRTNEEQTLLHRAASLTGASGGFAVPFDLDPTIIPTSNGVVNPVRQLARVVQTTVDTWRGVASGAVTASYKAEAAEMNDDAPTLTQPEISTERADSFIPFSYEIGMDWPGFRGEMATLIQDAKDTLEAGKFLTGTGTLEPFGLLTGVTNTVNAAAGADTFTLDNVISLTTALPARHRPNAAFLGNLAILQRIRTTDVSTKGGGVWQDSLQADVPARLLGRPIYEASEMPGDATTGNKFLVYGNFNRYVIVDRLGMTVELVPQLFGVNRRPTGQRGIVAYWRNGAKVVDANAFRALLGTI